MSEDGLPEGWTTEALKNGLVLDVQTGFACGAHSRDASGVAHVRPMNVSEEGRISLKDVKYVPLDEVDRDERWVRCGDVVFNNTNSPELVGKTAYYDQPDPRAFSNHMTRVRCRDDVLDPRFCALFLHHRWQEGHFQSICNNHVSQASISRSVLLDTEALLPPPKEQRRIVEKVEALLAEVNAAKDKLARVALILKRFRQAVLAAACSGRLTEEWRSATGSDSGSGAEVLQEIRAQNAMSAGRVDQDDAPYEVLPQSWDAVRFAELVTNYDGKRIPIKSSDREKRRGAYPYYGASGIIDSIDAYLFDGDYLLVAEDGANLLSRSTPIAFMASGRFWVNNHAHVVQPRGGIPIAYLEMFLNSLDLQHHVTGTAQPKLTQASLNSIVIPVPSLKEQHEIVRRVDALFALAGAVEKRLAEATRRVEKLPQAILTKAFRGELVPTEAELARAEGREYETAEALLRRIRGEQAAPSKPPRARTRRTP